MFSTLPEVSLQFGGEVDDHLPHDIFGGLVEGCAEHAFWDPAS